MRYIVLAFLAIVLFFSSGCLTTNWAHNKRHFRKWREELAQFHKDIDRILFDLPEMPAESAAPYPTTQQW
ncbi:MAG: hypothetical protein N2234_03040 [Planctomycetota bacterium]|nr:hypothetical protein [Planctomycetota bacterium]